MSESVIIPFVVFLKKPGTSMTLEFSYFGPQTLIFSTTSESVLASESEGLVSF